MRTVPITGLAAVIALLTVASSLLGDARANDTTAVLSIGGLQFTRTDSIRLDSEDLRISLDRVDVRYSFLNISGKPQTVTVAFPLPDIDVGEAEGMALPFPDQINFVGFETKIDGVPVPFKIEQRAWAGTRDVSALLEHHKLPLLPFGDREIRPESLSATVRNELINEGMLFPRGSDDRGRQKYSPAWTLKTSAVRTQTFPAGKPVAVEHRYSPSVGATVNTVLRKELRQNKGMTAEIARYRKLYCVSDTFLEQVDKLVASGSSSTSVLQTKTISYVLKTGANWSGPIRTFRLTVDSGGPDRLVSFCAGSLRISGTNKNTWEAANFTPTSDLNILVVGRF